MNAPETLPLGLVRGMSAADYFADPGVSNSMLTALKKSPAHCYALYLDPDRPESEKTAAMKSGTLAHTAILEPDQLLKRYAVKPPGMRLSTKAGMEWEAAVPDGVEIISDDQHKGALAQRAAVQRVQVLRRILSSGIAEASLFWIDKATGLRCKARPDWLHFIGATKVEPLDLKTISDLTPEAVEGAVTAYGYHRQRAHYLNGIRACGMQAEDFGFAFVSSCYPYIAAPYLLDDETCEQGADEVAELLATFADCKARNEWPAFGDGFQLTGLRKWVRRSQEVEVSFVED